MRRQICVVLVLSVVTLVGCGEPIGAPDIEGLAPGQPSFAVFHTDPPPTVTAVPGGFVLHKQLAGYPNYGVADGRSDILYSTESDVWNFDMSVISDAIASATAVTSLVLDDHYVRPESEYVGTITLNGTQVFSGGFSTALGASHGVPYGGIFGNWQSVSFPFSDLTPSTFTVEIHNNTTGQVYGDWIAIDYIEIHVVTVIKVDIDIKPGSDPNSINLGSKGTVPVAILSTPGFDATTVDPVSVTLADASVKVKGNGTPMASEEDVNGDGLLDLVVHVFTSGLQLTDGDVEAVLEGETYDGVPIQGSDVVRIVP